MKFQLKTFRSKTIKNIFLSYNRFQNGNAEIYVVIFNFNFLLYMQGLKKHIRKYKRYGLLEKS